jgi:hypothetical protein
MIVPTRVDPIKAENGELKKEVEEQEEYTIIGK